MLAEVFMDGASCGFHADQEISTYHQELETDCQCCPPADSIESSGFQQVLRFAEQSHTHCIVPYDEAASVPAIKAHQTFGPCVGQQTVCQVPCTAL